MVQNPEIARDDLVFENCPRGNVDLVSVVGDDDDRALQTHTFAKGDVATDGQVIQFDDVGDAGETIQEQINLKNQQ